MQVSSSHYLGSLVPTYTHQGLNRESVTNIAKEAEQSCSALGYPKIQVIVASGNILKNQAAMKAVEAWANTFFVSPSIVVQGIDVPSDIDEQPHSLDQTKEGAHNRLRNLITKVGFYPEKGVVRLLISMENGLMKENVANIRDAHIFQNEDKSTWVDRCFVVGRIGISSLQWDFHSLSAGVTAPRECVENSEKSNWTKTAGFFIADKYQCNAKDWHGSLAGKSRSLIMEEAILMALGLQK